MHLKSVLVLAFGVLAVAQPPKNSHTRRSSSSSSSRMHTAVGPNEPPTTQKHPDVLPITTKGSPAVHFSKPAGQNSPSPHGNTALHPSNTVNSNNGPSATSKKQTAVHSTATHKKESATTAISVTKSHKSATNTKITLARTSKSSSKAPTATGVTKWEGENNQHLCKDGQMNTGSWKANNVDHYLKQFWDEYPHNPVPQHGGEVMKDASFPHYLAQISGDYGNFKCHRAVCDIDVNDQEQCEKHPMIGFILYAIKNFQIFQEEMSTALTNQHDSWSDKVNQMTLDFTVHELKAPPSAVPFIIMAAFFGGLGVLGPLAGTADMIATTGFLAAAGAGGSSAMGFGTAAASSASDDRINVLQDEIKNTAKISEAFGKVRDGIWGAINDTANAVLTDKPGGQPKGLDAPSILGGGFFASHPEVADEKKFNDKFAESFAPAIVASGWYADQVFIVRVDPKKASVNGHNGCDGDLGKILNEARTCVDGKGYIFVRTDDINNLNKRKWTNPAGISKLKDYGLSLKKLVKAAEWYEKNVGAWNDKGLSMKDIPKYVQKKKEGPPDGLWVNLPIIDYDETPPKNPDNVHYKGRGATTLDHVINNVGAWIKPKDDWPYDSLA